MPPSLNFNQGPACARQKAHMQIGMAPAGAGPKYLSCQLQLETWLACVVKVLDILFTQGLRGDIMSFEAESLSSPPGSREHLKTEKRSKP